MDSFALDHLLKYCRNIEDQEKMALAVAKKNHQIGEGQVNHLQKTLDGSKADLKNAWKAKSVNIQLIRFQINYQEYLAEQINHAKQELAKLAKLVEQRRESLLKAATKVKMIETIEKKHIQKQFSKATKLERMFLDELATNRFIHLNKESNK